MAATTVLSVLSGIDKVLSALSVGLESEEWESMCKSLREFGDVLCGIVDASEQSRVVRQLAYDAVFKVKNSLQDILDESMIHRQSHQECQEIVKRLEDTIKFEQMPISDFLEEHNISQYGQLFTDKEVEYVGEILDGDNEEKMLKAVKPHMKIGSFSRFKKNIKKAKLSIDYIENKMEEDLGILEKAFTEASNQIGAKLRGFINDLAPVTRKLLEVIKDEETRMAIVTGAAICAFAIVGLSMVGTGIGCLVFGIPGLIAIFSGGALCCSPIASTHIGAAALVGVGAVAGLGGYAVYKARQDMKKDIGKLKNAEEMVTQWQQALRGQFLKWRELLSTFKELFQDLRKHHKQYKNQQSQIGAQFARTNDILNDALKQTNEFERMIKALRDKKVDNVHY